MLNITFENDARTMVVSANLGAGWNRQHYYASATEDFRGDRKLTVKMWVSGIRLFNVDGANQEVLPADSFPTDLSIENQSSDLPLKLTAGRLSMKVDLTKPLPWKRAAGGNVTLDWKPGPIAVYRSVMRYDLRVMVRFTKPQNRRGDIREWDFLPFLSGGRPESNRRRF